MTEFCHLIFAIIFGDKILIFARCSVWLVVFCVVLILCFHVEISLKLSQEHTEEMKIMFCCQA